MATPLFDSLLSILLFLILRVFCFAGETNITAKTGQNVTLPCKVVENKTVEVLEWSRTDLGRYEHVALYQDDTFNYHDQHPAYRDRVDLQDREMKDGNVSLVLKDVMNNDTGTYECRVIRKQNTRRKRSHLDSDPICNISLNVSSSGSKKVQKECDDKNVVCIQKAAYVVWIVFSVLGVVVFVLYKKKCKRSLQDQSTPFERQEQQAMNH